MASTPANQAQHGEHPPAWWLAFFRARPDLGLVAFGYGMLVAVNRLRGHSREMHCSGQSVAPMQAQLDRAIQELVSELCELGHLTAQPPEDIEMFTREAERLMRAAVAERCSWASLAAGCRRFTVLFAADFADVVDELYANAFDAFGNADEATTAIFNVCQVSREALADAGYGDVPVRAATA
jgi:hypothetical protein